MNKDGSAPAEVDKSRSALTILCIRTKDGRIHRITLPDEIYRSISSQFLRNLAKIASSRTDRSDADGRAAHRYARLYRRGFPLKILLRSAAETLEERDCKVVIRSLAREMNDRKKSEKAEIDWPDVDVAICYLDAMGELAGCTAEEGAKRLTDFLHSHGFESGLSGDSYRQRVKRLRRDGVRFLDRVTN